MKIYSITVEEYYVTPIIIALALLVLNLIRLKYGSRSFHKKNLWISFIVFLAVYMFIVGSALYDDCYYQWKYNQLNQAHNGIGESPAQIEAMNNLISDTGRVFSVYLGIIFAGGISIIVYLSGFFIHKYKNLTKNKDSSNLIK
ncbi:MAG: hypothetical protein PHV20_11985 [Bacteroidales bacterium]|nr:hypothetical protein [Bacteroidales bacterium]